MTKYIIIVFVLLLTIAGCKKNTSPTTPTPTTGTIAGRVLTATGDTAIASAAISTTPPTSAVFTDASGAYSITDVSPGNYAVYITKSGFYDGSVSVKVTAGSSTFANVQLARLVDKTGMIMGKVTNAGGDTLIVGASITTSPATSSVTTDAQGQYTINNVGVGSYTITATKGGYYAGNTTVTITNGKISTGDIKMNVIVNHAPTTPVLISPATNAIGQSLTTTLSWSCTDPDGDNLTYDIYCDKTSSPITKVSSSQTATTFTITNLDSATTYYWNVFARDSKGAISSSSAINKFTTVINHVPNTPVLISPINGVTGQDRSLTLIWSCSDSDGDALTYDVYLDKSISPTQKVSSSQTATSYMASNLDSASTYYWRIIAKDNKGTLSNSSFVNSFSTLNLLAGLLAYYPFNGNANDESGNGNNGTIYGAELAGDRFGYANKAFIFNGTNNYIRASGSASFGVQEFSIACFIKSTKILGVYGSQPIISYQKTAAGYMTGYNFELRETAGNIGCYGGRGSTWDGVQTNAVVHGDSKWHFIVGSKKNGILSIYIDGILQNSRQISNILFDGHENIWIGQDGYPQRASFGGLIDDVRFYNRALSDIEIQAIYHDGGWTGN